METIKNDLLLLMAPYLESLSREVGQRSNFGLFRCGITTDGPQLLAIAIICRPLNFPLTHVSLHFGCTMVVDFPEGSSPRLRAAAAWSRLYCPEHAGFNIPETEAFQLTYQGPDTLTRLAQELPRLEKAMLRGLARGRPPTRWDKVWDRFREGIRI